MGIPSYFKHVISKYKFILTEYKKDAKTIDNLYIANMMHVYPDERSVNNSIRLAAEACSVMGINSKFVPKGSSISAIIGFN